MAAVRRPSYSSFLLLIIFFLLFPPLLLSITDSEALIKLKKSLSDSKHSLDSWTEDSVPCSGKTSWVGVVCFQGIVTGLHLGQLGLSGNIDIDALHEISGLRSFSIVNNDFSGPIPDFNRLGALKGVYLSGNKFSGEIPPDYFSKMESLKKIWLSGNKFTGNIPTSLTSVPRLIELHLENNQFSGSIPSCPQSTLTSLNLSNNKLEGEIPATLSKFDKSAFEGNAGLCGTQLGKDCKTAAEGGTLSGTTDPTPPVVTEQTNPGESTKLTAATAILVAMLLLLVVSATLVMMRRRKEDFDVLGRENLDEPLDVQQLSTGSSRRTMESSTRKGSSHGKKNAAAAAAMGDLMMVNEEKGTFALTDLMKAAAEVLGNGSLGSAYKAVMSNGVAVVVKRMREMNKLGKEGFDMEMRQLGKLRHTNILTPLAYHYRKEEKLLIYEYVPKGSLLYLLHGDRGPSHAELDWPARLKIVKGIARGMGYLHTQLTAYSIPHGNLKSSNILLGSDYEPLLADYGFMSVVNTAQAAQAMLAFKAPESQQYRQVSPKCDVYCLGIVILEILTGKFPSQYLNNGKGGTDVVQWVLTAILDKREAELFDPEISRSKSSLGEMEKLLQIGAACVEEGPEKRPDMKEAIRRIEEIQVQGIQTAPSLGDGYAADQTSHALDIFEGHIDLNS